MNIRALVLAGALVFGVSLTAHAQITLHSSVIGAGGGPMTNGTLTVNGTVGQAIIGPIGSSALQDNQGFWYTLVGPTGSVAMLNDNPTGYELEQNYPNPFNPSTKIRFSVPERTKVTLRVMNLLGEEVSRIFSDQVFDPGKYEYEFQADNLPSGTYVYRLEAGNVIKTRKMVLMK